MNEIEKIKRIMQEADNKKLIYENRDTIKLINILLNDFMEEWKFNHLTIHEPKLSHLISWLSENYKE